MSTAIIFDCEFLTSEGAPQRFWCGPYDPDPVIAQIGAVKLSLEGEFAILDQFSTLIRPLDRHGDFAAIDPLFTRLTGISDDHLRKTGITLEAALHQLEAFSEGAAYWSWGKDELNMLAISCYVSGIAPPIPATRFENACRLLLTAGMAYDDIKRTRSNQLADFYGIDHPPLNAHDALDDALSVAYVLQHLLREGVLKVRAFATGGGRGALPPSLP